MNHIFEFNSAKIISKHTYILEINFLEAFYSYKNHKNIFSFDFTTPSLSDCWKYYRKTSFLNFY